MARYIPSLLDHDALPPVLIVLHQEHSTPGRIGRIFRELGVSLDIRYPRFGDALPTSLNQHSGAVIFGGPMSTNDPDDWIKREIDWIETPLKENKPFLGVCLGAQMLARKLGQSVRAHPQGRVEVGYCPVEPTDSGEALCGYAFPTKVYQWHREGFETPRGAALLAQGQEFHAQAIAVGKTVFGLQFHPEVTYAMICRWTMQAQEDLMNKAGAQTREEQLEGWFRYDRDVAAWLRSFLTQWLSCCVSTTTEQTVTEAIAAEAIAAE